jgi:hypothetical protein
MKIPLKTKSLHGIYVEGFILTKDKLIIAIGMVVKHVFFAHKMGQSNICSSYATLHVLYSQSSKQRLACILLLVLPISLEIGYTI